MVAGMLPVRSAVQAAMDYIAQFSDLVPANDVRLEETDFDDRANEWYVTLSIVDNEFTGHRIYKLFRVDGDSGLVKSMKNRNPYAKA